MVNLAGQDLCHQCAQSLRQIIDGYNNALAVQYNHLLDMADAGGGIPSGMPRMPVTRPVAPSVLTGDTTYKHIEAPDADIEVINQDGQLDRIDLAMEDFARRGGEAAELSKLTEAFVNAVLGAGELRPEDKRALTHVVSTLLSQLETPEPRRIPRNVLKSIYDTVSPLLRDVTSLTERWGEVGAKLAEPLKLADV